ncbi:MAG: bifunctional phosphopantothenoylcysteine decarboxylase/phosphopantothenate--cysteine ligase CoaBC [Chlorobiaceae bacterium]|nr:bifunctional phosphopantothenoylcysteine decarboxylase/phosphopantothenate--cysteine ligase CoaBC [Chlorobiaceae bacterium]NTV60772.1 bifunctional phosphopantothenoylcysteine decarboxylase/phosphopantothenate--cysteine ligase CoaBC [Chlorobiaceae bacterium]
MDLTGKNIIIGICGGIAAYKTPHLVRLLKKKGANVRVALTDAGTRFVSELSLATVSQGPVYRSIFPPTDTHGTDFTTHISLGEWADALVIAPATANTLARLAAGLCDDMLATCFLTLRPGKPVLIFPAMDGQMYLSHSVQRNIATLKSQGAVIIEPESGELASGQCGTGRMPEPEAIVEHIETALLSLVHSSPLHGKSIVVTAGPTREKIDDVRFLSNYSSGKMGFAIAKAAGMRGARVTLISGPVGLATPPGVERIDVESAAEMRDAAGNFFPSCDIFIGAAAVADYRPAAVIRGKLKKNDPELQFTLVKNPDILGDFGQQKNPVQLAVGFALEQENGIDNARKKLEEKNLDLIALNFSDRRTSGFEVDTNMLTLIKRGGPATELPMLSKEEAARKLLDTIENICRQR